MAGDLEVSVAGHPALLHVHGSDMLLHFEKRRALLSMRNKFPVVPDGMLELVMRSGVKFEVQFGDWRAIEVFPKPNWMLTMTNTKLRDAAQ